jgi:hypothetical protein
MSPSPKLNTLVAYPYLTKGFLAYLAEHQSRIRLFVDSGAFTAWKAGETIHVDDYCRFIESLPFKPWRYFALDVVGNPEQTASNYDTMLRRGFSPVPIFTRGEDPRVLEHYYATSDMVAVGGLVGTSGNQGFVKGIMGLIGSRKCHWLGFTSMKFIQVYKPSTCDSSSWEGGARYGRVGLWMGNGREIGLTKANFKQRPAPEIAQRISSMGFDPMALATSAAWHGGRSISRSLSAASAVLKSRDVERKTGTLLFNAASTPLALEQLVRHFQAAIERKAA